jgi:hypothetical protein
MSKKRKNAPAVDDDKADAEYVAQILQNETKKFVTKFSFVLEQLDPKIKIVDFRHAVELAGFTLPKTTLNNWRREYKEDDFYFDYVHSTGRPPALTQDQVDLMTGYILAQNAKHLPVRYEQVLAFLKKEFDVTVTLPTVINYCASSHLAKLVAKVRKGSKGFTRVDQTAIAASFVKDLLANGFYGARRSSVCNMDVTFTTHRNRKVTTIGPKGRCDFF